MDVRASRRRKQISVEQTAVSTIFNTPDEYFLLEYKAIISRMRYAIQSRGMLIYDAFKAFNSSNTGLLTCSELYGGLEWLGMKFTPDQIYDIVRRIAVDNEGLISYADFKAALKDPLRGAEEEEVMLLTMEEEGRFPPVPPKPIPELYDHSRQPTNSQAQNVTDDMLEHFKVWQHTHMRQCAQRFSCH